MVISVYVKGSGKEPTEEEIGQSGCKDITPTSFNRRAYWLKSNP